MYNCVSLHKFTLYSYCIPFRSCRLYMQLFWQSLPRIHNDLIGVISRWYKAVWVNVWMSQQNVLSFYLIHDYHQRAHQSSWTEFMNFDELSSWTEFMNSVHELWWAQFMNWVHELSSWTLMNWVHELSSWTLMNSVHELSSWTQFMNSVHELSSWTQLMNWVHELSSWTLMNSVHELSSWTLMNSVHELWWTQFTNNVYCYIFVSTNTSFTYFKKRYS